MNQRYRSIITLGVALPFIILLVTGCAFSKPLRITVLHVDVEKCDLMLAQENPDLAKDTSENSSTIGSLIELLGDEVAMVLTLLKAYPFVDLDFEGTVNVMDLESEAAKGTSALYKAIEKFVAKTEAEQ